MLSYQKNALLSLLAQLKVKLLIEHQQTVGHYYDMAKDDIGNIADKKADAIYKIIDRNLTSIEKQIKRL